MGVVWDRVAYRRVGLLRAGYIDGRVRDGGGWRVEMRNEDDVEDGEANWHFCSAVL